jgi:hypothetical protein
MQFNIQGDVCLLYCMLSLLTFYFIKLKNSNIENLKWLKLPFLIILINYFTTIRLN